MRIALALAAVVVLASAVPAHAQAPPVVRTVVAYDKDETPDLPVVGVNRTGSLNWVPDNYVILDINVYVLIGNRITDGSDLSYTLVSPGGRQARLKVRGLPGGLNTIYDRVTPSVDPLTIFDGQSTFGAWTLRISTTDNDTSGPLKGWQLQFTVDNAAAGTPGHAQPVAGLGNAGNAGRFEVFDNDLGGFQPLLFGTLPFNVYNAINGETRVAAGNFDGDRRDELAVGLGPSAQSNSLVAILDDQAAGFALLTWIRAPWTFDYDLANGETWVAAGDVDGDGLDEIVVGQGTFPLDGGRFAVFDDARAQFNLIADKRLPWGAYNATNGEVRPACGDVDGDGYAEILIGTGTFPANGGWVAVFDDARTGFRNTTWFRLRWPLYNASVGSTRPAAGDVDGDGKAEVVLGLDAFPAAGGWFEVRDDAAHAYAHLRWVQVPNVAYNAANGSTRPALDDVDGDRRAEILIGTGPDPGNQFNMFLFDDAAINYGFRRFFTVQDAAYTAANGETWPTLGLMK